MGFNTFQWKFINKCFTKSGLLKQNNKLPKYGIILNNEVFYGKQMLELGCQEIRTVVRNRLQSKGTAKSYFKSIGIKHVSMDIKGCHRSKKFDLREPIPYQYYNKFDIITNSGTTEHIIPLEGQYQTFKNIHLCAKVGSVMIHILPGIGDYYGHCQVYYKNKFFKVLAELNDYEIVLLEPIKNRKTFVWIGICMIKKSDNEFTTDKTNFFKHIQWIKKSLYKKHKKNKNKYM